MSQFGTAHFYGHYDYHSPVYVLANREALSQLRDAIDKALTHGQAMTELFTNDGEGYPLFVVTAEGDSPYSPFWADVAKPYTADYAAEQDEQTRGPWDMLDFETMVAVGNERTQQWILDCRARERARLAEEG